MIGPGRERRLIPRFFGSPYLRGDKLADLFYGLGERSGSRKAPHNSFFRFTLSLVRQISRYLFIIRMSCPGWGECLVNRIFPKGDSLRGCWCRIFSGGAGGEVYGDFWIRSVLSSDWFSSNGSETYAGAERPPPRTGRKGAESVSFAF